MITKKQLGANIRHHRTVAGLSQESLAFSINSEKCSISEWETGKHWPYLPKVLAMCEVLGIEPNDLMLR